MIPKSAQLAIKMIVPYKYDVIDTEILSCVFAQHGVLKKCVMDNLKEASDRVIKNKTKQPSGDKKLLDFSEIEVSDECKILLDNFLFFFNQYNDKLTTDIITAYISFILISDDRLKSFAFFDENLYVKSKQPVSSELLNIITTVASFGLSRELTNFGEYLTNGITLRKYDCFGREDEIESCIDVMRRFTKNNVILLGQSGVGKTTIVHGICNYLQSKNCPKQLLGFPVFELDVNRLVSGAIYRGELEKRLETVITELKKFPNTILFIDEIHMLFNRDSDETGSSMQNSLKPFLSSGSRVIGCTTDSDYKLIERDKAFERRFSVVRIEEQDQEDTYKTLRNEKQKYENHYSIKIDDDSLRRIVSLCKIYIKNRCFPDKAFDVLDISCANATKNGHKHLQDDDISKGLYKLAGIDPTSRHILSVSDSERIIKESIFGQDESIDAVCRQIKKYYLGISDKTKPIGSFLLVGPTGTGKTELCKQIAKHFFTDESFIRYDMSEFMESHSISKLIGSPPGYVGFRSGGTLTEKIKHNPFSVILFDEVEKANVDVLNILLQIMDDGRLTDSNGNTVDFCNCLILMTSNIGCRAAVEKSKIGFNSGSDIKSTVGDEINAFFSPEFRNRLTGILYFNQITEDIFDKIFRKELNDILNIYKSECNLDVNIDNFSIDNLKKICYNSKNGVRYITRCIHDIIDDLVIESIINSKSSVDLVIDEKGKATVNELVKELIIK